MKKIIFVIFNIFLSLCFFELSNAQEIQIPIDEEGKLEYINSELEKNLGLFKEYPNFIAARLFQIADTSFVLEIFYRPEETLLKKRIPFSVKEISDFKQHVMARIEQIVPESVLDQEGRTKLIVGITTLSLGYYGWAIPVAFEVDDSKLAVALYMLTGGAGFFFPFSITKDIAVTDAAATLSIYGGYRGIVHGIALANVFSKDPSSKAVILSGMVASIVEGICGFHIANSSNMSAGTAEVIGTGGDFGIGYGLGIAHLADLEDQAVWGSILLSSGAGLFVGNSLAKSQPYTRGDAYVLSTAGLLGAYIPLAIVDIAEGEDKAYSTASMVGATIGLWAGHSLVKGKDFTTGQGRLVGLGTMVGGLVGSGLAYLMSSDNDNSVLFLTSSAIGASGGFWIMYNSFAEKAQATKEGLSWNFNIEPAGLLALTMGNKIGMGKKKSLPFLNIDFRF
jgi:hypothetical protein